MPDSLFPRLRPLANCLRALSIDAVEAAKSGHPGMPLGMADVATVLYARHLKFNPGQPHWPDRDRVVFSGGHGSMLLYALHHLTGYAPMTLDQIKSFRQLGSICAGHPERDVDAGIEVTTGPLGQGLGVAVGLAIAERNLNTRFGDAIVSHRIWVLAGDGDLQEGVSHEASALAGHLALKNLIILYDDNGISIDGPTSLSFSEDVVARYAAYGFATRRVDGHDIDAVDAALSWATSQDKPVLIACKTTIGFGSPKKSGTADVHGSPLGPDEAAATKAALNWPHAPFTLPDDIQKEWQAIGKRGHADYTAWESRLAAAPDDIRQSFITEQAGLNPHGIQTAIETITQTFETERPNIATRKSSERVIDALTATLPNLIGGSADLTGSNLTRGKTATILNAQNYAGTYIHYGVREFGMAAIMNGIALHGGLRPFGGTFLCFVDYLRPALRLSALMHAPVIYVMTHDSIGLGEDGPTHQPIEHLASLRAIPNVRVYRPADSAEVAACWAEALAHTSGPSVLCLSRQNLPTLPNTVIRTLDIQIPPPPSRGRVGVGDITLVATGSEVSIAVTAADMLRAQGKNVRVVSLPCFETFLTLPPGTRDHMLGDPTTTLRVGIEAGVRQGWDAIIGANGLFIGLTTFGASAPAADLYRHFALTPEDIVRRIKSL